MSDAIKKAIKEIKATPCNATLHELRNGLTCLLGLQHQTINKITELGEINKQIGDQILRITAAIENCKSEKGATQCQTK